MIIDLDSWEAGYYDALAGRPSQCTASFDQVSYSSGYSQAHACGAERVLRAGLYPEDIARQIKGSDLAATVAQGFEGAHRSADHFVEISSRTAFAVDLCIARKHHGRAHLLDRPGE